MLCGGGYDKLIASVAANDTKAAPNTKVAFGADKKAPFLPPVLVPPRDSEGFIQAFAVDETKAFKEV